LRKLEIYAKTKFPTFSGLSGRFVFAFMENVQIKITAEHSTDECEIKGKYKYIFHVCNSSIIKRKSDSIVVHYENMYTDIKNVSFFFSFEENFEWTRRICYNYNQRSLFLALL